MVTPVWLRQKGWTAKEAPYVDLIEAVSLKCEFHIGGVTDVSWTPSQFLVVVNVRILDACCQKCNRQLQVLLCYFEEAEDLGNKVMVHGQVSAQVNLG